jgi:hypothetical protein
MQIYFPITDIWTVIHVLETPVQCYTVLKRIWYKGIAQYFGGSILLSGVFFREQFRILG